MHPIVRDPDAVRVGDWCEPMTGSPTHRATSRGRDKKSRVLFGLVLAIGMVVLAVEPHQAVTKERTSADLALSRSQLGQSTETHIMTRSSDASATVPVEFVDDWTFVYPAPTPW